MDPKTMLSRYEHSQTYARSTTSLYTLHARMFLTWCELTNRDPLKVEQSDFSDYFAHRLEEGLAPRSVDPIRSGLKSFYGWLVDTGDIATNPVPARSSPQPPNALPFTLSVEQLRTMWRLASTPDRRALVGLLGLCGLGPDDAVAIDVSDCRLTEAAPSIQLHLDPANGRSQLLPLAPQMRGAIITCIDGRTRGPLLRRREGTRLDRRTALRWIRQMGIQAGISQDLTSRDLSFSLRALAIEHGFTYLSTVRAVGELNPTRSRRWWEHAPDDTDRHAAIRLAHLVFNDTTTPEGAVEEAFRSHFESHLPDAFSVMAAASALERHVRHLAHCRGIVPTKPESMTLASWADLLRGKGVLDRQDQASIHEVAAHRSWAAHGWYERITPEIALRVLEDCRRLVASLPVETAAS